jgi:hypothetical protein
MTMPELARLFQRLGAVDAINLDGGGSATMWLNGMVANRPSDGTERPVSNALVVLPGASAENAALLDLPFGTIPVPLPTDAPLDPADPDSPVDPTGPVDPPPALRRGEAAADETVVPGWEAAARDAGSIGGLVAHVAAAGGSLPSSLRRTGLFEEQR